MASNSDTSRRAFCRDLLFASAAAMSGTTAVRAAEAAALDAGDPAARRLKYTEDASQAPQSAGHKCSDCGLYEGKYGSSQGPCQLFPDKQVKAAGWCSAWAPQI